MARKPPKSPEQRLARWSRSMAPGTLNGRVASATPLTLDVTRLAPRLRQRQGRGFDPNETPVIIGAAATAGGGSTPDSPSAGHVGSVAVGASAVVVDDYTVAIGQSAAALGQSAVAIGKSAEADGLGSVAIGMSAVANVDYAIAIGDTAQGNNDKAIAIGFNAQAWGPSGSVAIGQNANVPAYATHSSAIGPDAACNDAHQLMLGTPADFVEIPGDSSTAPNGLVLTDTDGSGNRWIAQVTGGAWALSAAP